MVSDERTNYSQIREQRRREWAALQNPELVTMKQALEMLGRKSSVGFSDFLKSNNIQPIKVPNFLNANFYFKEDIEYLLNRAILPKKRGVGRPIGSQNNLNKRITFESMKDGSWTIDEFMQAWGTSETTEQVRSLLERAPSVLKLSPVDAQQLMLILSRLGGMNFRVSGFKFDKKYFYREISYQIVNREEQKKLAQILDSLYESTDIGVFEPNILVKILYELMVSKPNK